MKKQRNLQLKKQPFRKNHNFKSGRTDALGEDEDDEAH